MWAGGLAPGTAHTEPDPGRRAIEDDFPIEALNAIAEAESWRKEVYRPVYHIHKWWAQRLGSVFRGILLASALPAGTDVMKEFYEPNSFRDLVVFDPFMGSGTTVGEAQKLGCTVIGGDINPVAYRAARAALGAVQRHEVLALYHQLERSVGKTLRGLYRSIDSAGHPCDVLYFFWVKTVPCPQCQAAVELFPTYVFASHAYPKTHPEAKVLCPACRCVLEARFNARHVKCPCGHAFDPQQGPAKRSEAVCPKCMHEFPIGATVRASGRPPEHRMYAKLVLRADGTKEYLPVTEGDYRLFQEAQDRFAESGLPVPRVPIADGYNTRQVLNYGYRTWDQMFNDRQLLALGILAQSVRDLPAGNARDLLAVLFSGVLEFNNMFASYKGEGTGAVRHMFSHHILKPERTPIEANVWGTPKSSGSFSTLFRSRVLRALDYREDPFEIAISPSKSTARATLKVRGINTPFRRSIDTELGHDGFQPGSTYLYCGDSAQTDIPSRSVDLVVTDPPFFDNVNYSELADFFHVWQCLYFPEAQSFGSSTRVTGEVQDRDPGRFADKLTGVFSECNRVLKDHGLLVFTYHHSREDGWTALGQSLRTSGFRVVASYPVKSEMTGAAPKNQAKEPIDLDVVLVCRKRIGSGRVRPALDVGQMGVRVADLATSKIRRWTQSGRRLSLHDVHVIVFGCALEVADPEAVASNTAYAALVSVVAKAAEQLVR